MDRIEVRAPDVLASVGATDMASLPEQLRLENRTIKWFFLKNMKRYGKFYPSAQNLFAKKFKKESISAINFIRTVTHLSLIETGFIPLTPKKIPVCSIQQLLSLTLEERMDKLTDTLMLYLSDKSKSKLDIVYYTYIKAKDQNIEQKLLSPATSRTDEPPIQEIDKFEYSTDTYKLFIWYSGEKTFITFTGNRCDLSLEINGKLIWSNNIKNKQKLPLQELILQFAVEKYLSQIKKNICYAFIDKFNAVSTEYQGFQQLPDEVLENFANYLDARSMLKFSSTCHRMNRILDSETNWKTQCDRIPGDFARYGYSPPSQNTLRSRLTEEGKFKDKYKGIYVQAKSDFLQTQQRIRNINNMYNYRFAHLPRVLPPY